MEILLVNEERLRKPKIRLFVTQTFLLLKENNLCKLAATTTSADPNLGFYSKKEKLVFGQIYLFAPTGRTVFRLRFNRSPEPLVCCPRLQDAIKHTQSSTECTRRWSILESDLASAAIRS